MSEKSKENCPDCDNCHNCCSSCGGSMIWQILRWLLGIVILLIVFYVGVKIGEFKESVGGGYWGRGEFGHMMRGYPAAGGQRYFFNSYIGEEAIPPIIQYRATTPLPTPTPTK